MTTVVNASQRNRYEVYFDGDLAGLAEYLEHDNQRIFYHTEIGTEFGGKGLASTLIRRALEDTVGAGLRIVALCPFVKGYVDKHDELTASVDAPSAETVALVRDR